MKEVKDDAGQIQQWYQNALSYQKQMGFTADWSTFIDFKELRQWPAATEKTKHMPRPVFPLIPFLLRHKIANVTSENVKMAFKAVEVVDDETDIANEAAEKFTQFADATGEEMQIDELDAEALDDCATLGTTIQHFYYDNDIKGGYQTKYIGRLAGETIDPMNFFVANPQQKNVQKQPWAMVSVRDVLDNVKEIAKANKVSQEKIDMIKADKDTADESYQAAKYEMADTEKTTVVCCYKKIDGIVHYNKVASGISITNGWINTKKKLYPLCVMSWESRKKSIFGISEVEGLIPNQKIINFLIAMQSLSIQDTAWPKWIVKYGALKGQIKNIPGEVLFDTSEQPGDNIKASTPPVMNGQAAALVDAIVNYTRMFTGANEVATGEPFTKDLNASAIIALQNASKIPIEMIKKRYYRFVEDRGRIWEEFFKENYNMDRNFVAKDDDGNEVAATFNGEKYKDIPLRLKIDVGAASSFSESLGQATLDKFYDKGEISILDYMEFSSDNVVPFKERLKKRLEKRAGEQAQMAQEITPDEFMKAMPVEIQDYLASDPQMLQQMMQMQPDELAQHIAGMMEGINGNVSSM